MAEASEKDRRFRNAIYIFLLLLLIGYLGFKTWHISIAMDVWQDQKIEGDKAGAAK